MAESVFIAGLFVLAAKEMAAIAAQLGRRPDRPRAYSAGRAGDGSRPSGRRAGMASGSAAPTTASGDPVGSQECEEGQIFIEPQGMCIMAGLGLEDGRARQALDSVAERLATPHGIVLHQPAYTRYYLHLGEISSYPPGYKENAGIFCHTNPWIMIAEDAASGAATGRTTTTCASTHPGGKSSARCTAASRTSTPR